MEPDYAASLILATDPTTPADILERLWVEMGAGTGCVSREGNQVMDAIARNPNLPAKLAPACLGAQAKALAENPALPLLMLECPDIARQSPVERLLRTLRRPDTPTEVVRLLAQHHRPIVAEAARLHVSLAGELSEGEVEVELRKELAALPVGGKTKLQELHAWGLVPKWLAEKYKLKPVPRPKIALISQGGLSDEAATEEERQTARRIVETCDKEALKKYVEQPAKQVQQYPKREVLALLSEFPDIQEATLGRYGNIGWAFPRIIACMSEELLLRLYQEGKIETRMLVYHPNLPVELYQAIGAAEIGANRGLVNVLSIVAIWPKTWLHEYALSKNWHERLGVALNPKASEKDLRRLQKDANRIVRGVATYRASASRGFGRPEPHRSA